MEWLQKEVRNMQRMQADEDYRKGIAKRLS